MATAMERKGKGRQKTKMIKMTKESNLQVTFSKRRTGVFKKASELCTLCGVEAAVVVFSPSKKVYSFGHPCVESVVAGFQRVRDPTLTGVFEARRTANIRDLNVQVTQAVNRLEAEKKEGEVLTQMEKACRLHCWWAVPLEDLTVHQLLFLKASLEDMKTEVERHAAAAAAAAAAAPGFITETINPTACLSPPPHDAQMTIGFQPFSHDSGFDLPQSAHRSGLNFP